MSLLRVAARGARLGVTLGMAQAFRRLVEERELGNDAAGLDEIELGLRTAMLEWMRRACEGALERYHAERARRDLLDFGVRPGVH